MTRQIDNDALDFPTSYESDKCTKKKGSRARIHQLVYSFSHLVHFFLFLQRTSVHGITIRAIISYGENKTSKKK